MPEAGISPSSLDALHRMALRYAGRPDEADDLVQDVLLAALEQQRPWDGAGFLAWAAGVLRRRALFIARTEGRRRRREAAYAAHPAPSRDPDRTLPRQFIETLPPSLQTVALLANIGLGRAEIASLLGIADTALRQRISGLRRAWRRSGGTPERGEIPRGYPPPSGLRRRTLKAGLTRLPGGRLAIADYYHQNSSIRFIDGITIPTLILNAKNDPFLSQDCFPIERFKHHPTVQLIVPDRGGHVGFSQFSAGGLYWSEEKAMRFLEG